MHDDKGYGYQQLAKHAKFEVLKYRKIKSVVATENNLKSTPPILDHWGTHLSIL